MSGLSGRARSVMLGFGLLLVAAAIWLVLVWPRPEPLGVPSASHPADPQADPVTVRASNVDAEPRGERRLAVSEDSATAGDEPPAYRRALGGLRGRLVWRGSRRPVVDTEVAVVELWLDAFAGGLDDFHAAERREPAVFRARTRTDRDGWFWLPGLHARATLVLAIGLGTPAAAVRFVDRMPGPGETVDLGEVELLERGGVAGRVVDAEGRPVEGARVRVLDLPRSLLALGATDFHATAPVLLSMGGVRVGMDLPRWAAKYDAMLPFAEARTDSGGLFAIRGARPGRAILLVTHPRFAKHQGRVVIVAETSPTVGDIRLKTAGTLVGRFVDGRGQPVAGVEVTAATPRPFSPFGWCRDVVRSDADGRFALPGLGRGMVWLLYRRTPGGAWEVDGPHRADADVRIALAPSASASIRVERLDGMPIEAATLALYDVYAAAFLPGFERRIDGAHHLHEAAPGTWQVRNVPPGEYKVVARKPGFALGTAVLDLRSESASRTARVVLAPARAERFEVRDVEGRPVAGARIYWDAATGRSGDATFHQGGKARLTESPLLLGATDAAGELTTSVIEGQAKGFVCRHPAFALVTSGLQETGGEPIRFVLRGGGAIEGVVSGWATSSAHGVLRARPSERLRQRFGRLSNARYTHCSPDGSFRFGVLEPGEWSIELVPGLGQATSLAAYHRLAEAEPLASAAVTVTEGDTASVTLDPSAASTTRGSARVFGRVRSNGQPVGAGRIVIRGPGGRSAGPLDDDGAFDLPGLAAGVHTLSLERHGGDGLVRNRVWQVTVELNESQQLRRDVELREGSLTLRVVDPSLVPVTGLIVRLVRPGSGRGVDIGRVTDRDGRARFERVPSGGYEIRGASLREPEWVFEAGTRVHVGVGERQETVRVMGASVLEGYVQLDLSGLDPADREFARVRPPKQLVLRQGDRFMWGPLTPRRTRADQPPRFAFALRGAGPGTWHVVPRGALQWSAPPFLVHPGGDRRRVITLIPNADALGVERRRVGK